MPAIRTYDGRLVDPFNLQDDDVRPETLIHAISCINRFTGHSKYPYSVGQHTLALIEHVPVDLKPAALVHDWAEAWFNDLASPVKAVFPEYKEYEHDAMMRVAYIMGVSEDMMDDLDYFDKEIYIDERNALFQPIENFGMGDERTGLGIHPNWFRQTHYTTVKTDLLNHFFKLFPTRSIIDARPIAEA